MTEPHRDIFILLDYPLLPYRPGDVLTGHLMVEKLKIDGANASVDYVQLNLEGSNQYMRRGRYTGDSYTTRFLSYNERVLPPEERNTDVNDPKFEIWPFRIQIPLTTGPPDAGPTKVHRVPPSSDDPRMKVVDTSGTGIRPRFADSSGPHPLPPVLLQISNDTDQGTNFASVAYSISASVYKPGSINGIKGVVVRSFGDRRTVRQFWLTLHYSAADATGGGTTTKPFRFVLSNRKLQGFMVKDNVRETGQKKNAAKLLKSLSKDPPPAVSFEATVSTPKHVHLDGTFSIEIGLRVTDKPANFTELPVVSMTWLVVKVKRISYAYGKELFQFNHVANVKHVVERAKGPNPEFRPRPAAPTSTAVADEGHPTDNMEINRVTSHSNGEAALEYVTRTTECVGLLAPAKVTPDFATINLCVAHELVVSAMFECCGETKGFDMVFPLRVLPSSRVGGTEDPAWFAHGPQDKNEQWASLTQVNRGVAQVHELQLVNAGVSGSVNVANGVANLACLCEVM